MSPQINLNPHLRATNGYWYEAFDGTCTINQPVLIHQGDDQPNYLLFPVHWPEFIAVLPEAKRVARESNALLVLVLYGELSLDTMKALVVEFAAAQVLSLWVGEQNRKNFNQSVALLSQGNYNLS